MGKGNKPQTKVTAHGIGLYRPNKNVKLPPQPYNASSVPPQPYNVVNSLNPLITRRNKSASEFRIPPVLPVPTVSDDCTLSIVKDKAQRVVNICRLVTEDVRVQRFTDEIKQLDRNIHTIVMRIPQVNKMWSLNPSGAQQLLATHHPKINEAIENRINRINTLRSEVDTIVTPFRDKLRVVRNEVLQCYNNNKRCVTSDPSTLGHHIRPECKAILATISSIDSQLESCSVFNLRTSDVVTYYKNTEETDKAIDGRKSKFEIDVLVKGIRHKIVPKEFPGTGT